MRYLFVNICAASAILFNIAYADSYKLRFYNVTTSEGVTCQQYSENIAKLIKASFPSIEAVAQLCEFNDLTKTTNLTVIYESDEELLQIGTHTAANFYPARGLYLNREECEESLSSEQEVFQNLTGVIPLVSYCAYKRHDYKWQWYPNITGLTAHAKGCIPGRTDWSSGFPVGHTELELKLKAQGHLEHLGLYIYALTFRPSSILGSVTMHFYQPAQQDYFSARSQNVVKFSDLNQCVTATNLLDKKRAMFTPFTPYVMAYCSSRYSNLNNFDLTVVTGSELWSVKYSSEIFAAAETCEKRRPQIEKSYQLVYPKRIIGSLCGLKGQGVYATENEYHVAILVK